MDSYFPHVETVAAKGKGTRRQLKKAKLRKVNHPEKALRVLIRTSTIATGGSSGPYNIIATTLAEGYSNEFDVNSRTQTTGASAENLNLLGEEKVEMAFVMSDALTQAVNGEETFSEPIENVQQVAALYPNFVQVITTEGAGIESIDDLAGKRVAVGDQNSGVEIATRSILDAHGMTYDDMEVDYLDTQKQRKRCAVVRLMRPS